MNESIITEINRAKSELYESNDRVIATQIAFEHARREYEIALDDRNLKTTTVSILIDRMGGQMRPDQALPHTFHRSHLPVEKLT